MHFERVLNACRILPVILVGPGLCLASDSDMFPLTQVRLQAGPFKHAADANLHYLLDLDPDRLLAPFLHEAGLPKPIIMVIGKARGWLDIPQGIIYLPCLI